MISIVCSFAIILYYIVCYEKERSKGLFVGHTPHEIDRENEGNRTGVIIYKGS